MAGLHKQRVGIMGGTFDPIHYGHLYIAECSRYKFGLEKVLFIPSGRPVHKKRDDVVDAGHRLEMARLAIDSNPYFILSDIEVERQGPTYTVDTLEYLNNEGDGRHEFFFITGADAILEIMTWKNVARVFELCQFIAVTRPGFSLARINQVMEHLTVSQRERIHFHETTGIMVSSTEIRESIARGEPVKYLLPESVEQYIINHNLYNTIK